MSNASNWIDIEDQEPTESGYYLAYYSHEMDNGLEICFYRKDDRNIYQGWGDYGHRSDIKYWQPLPKLPIL